MVDRSQKVHQLGFKCVRIFTRLFKWKFKIPFKLFHSLEADRSIHQWLTGPRRFTSWVSNVLGYLPICLNGSSQFLSNCFTA